jgi:hypothetical protein
MNMACDAQAQIFQDADFRDMAARHLPVMLFFAGMVAIA